MKLSKSRRILSFYPQCSSFLRYFTCSSLFWTDLIFSPDSETYIAMSLHREPLYSLFLALMRALFGPDREKYLMGAIIIQSLLTAVAAWSIPAFLYKKALPPQTGRLSSAHDAFWGVLIVPLRCGKTRYVLHQH